MEPEPANKDVPLGGCLAGAAFVGPPFVRFEKSKSLLGVSDFAVAVAWTLAGEDTVEGWGLEKRGPLLAPFRGTALLGVLEVAI